MLHLEHFISVLIISTYIRHVLKHIITLDIRVRVDLTETNYLSCAMQEEKTR